MRVLVATDAWHPQVNGVVRTYEAIARELPALGAELAFITPADFRSLPCPTYPEIRLALPRPGAFARLFAAARAQAVHIATEGPIGLTARAYCRKHGLPFTTSYHTRFPEYIAARLPVRERWCYAFERRFHNAATAVMVATPSLARELAGHGLRNLVLWPRGVDTELFRPRPIRRFGAGPVFLYVGRVAVEKNIEAFLALDLPGIKVVVGDGPQLAGLRRRYPTVLFAGRHGGESLAECIASADVLVFPSRTDTFGIVMLEALASGVPVAAFPVTGPRDLLAQGGGVLDGDLRRAALAALDIDRARCRALAERYSWRNSAGRFVANVAAAQSPLRSAA